MAIRSFDRTATEMRPVTIERNYLKTALGSCLVAFGDTKVLCAASIQESVGAWRRNTGLGWVTAEYSMLPASTKQRTRRETSGQKGRTHEIQRLIGRSLRSVTDMGGLGGEITVTIDCDVIQADGGTRTASITGAWVALHDALEEWKRAGKIASNPLFGHVAAVSLGIVDGEILVDLDYSEDSVAEVDMNVVMDDHGQFIEVQGTGEAMPFSRDRLDSMLDLASDSVSALVELQKQTIEA